MKRIAATLLPLAAAAVLLSAALAPQASAQPRRGGGFQYLVDTLVVRLGLSEEQTAKVKEIVKNTQEQMRLDREAFAEDRETLMLAMRERMDTMFTDIDSLLTPEQKAEYKALREDMSKRRGGGPGGPGGPGGAPGGTPPSDGNR